MQCFHLSTISYVAHKKVKSESEETKEFTIDGTLELSHYQYQNKIIMLKISMIKINTNEYTNKN